MPWKKHQSSAIPIGPLKATPAENCAAHCASTSAAPGHAESTVIGLLGSHSVASAAVALTCRMAQMTLMKYASKKPMCGNTSRHPSLSLSEPAAARDGGAQTCRGCPRHVLGRVRLRLALCQVKAHHTAKWQLVGHRLRYSRHPETQRPATNTHLEHTIRGRIKIHATRAVNATA